MMRVTSPRGSEEGRARAAAAPVGVGDYFCTERALFRVEHAAGERVLVEDCRSGDLIDVSAAELLELKRVERA
jgi:hypothetical protein